LNKNLDRPIIIDGSLYGMGKSAGNACTELLAMYMNEFCGRDFNINQIQEAIDVDIIKEFDKKSWGYDFEYYIAALNECHPSYVQYLLRKKTLSVKSVNEILVKIKAEKKLSYDEQLIETLYCEYQDRQCDDTLTVEALKREFSGKKILLLGPGKTLQDNYVDIIDFIQNNNPIVVSINFMNELFPVDYVFMGNAKRYSQFFHKLYGENSKVKIICTSNITEAGREIDYLLNYTTLLAEDQVIRDNPFVMFLHLLRNIGLLKIWLAGFDGYTDNNSINYYGDYLRLLYCQDNVVLRNEAIKKEMIDISKTVQIISLTPSRYL